MARKKFNPTPTQWGLAALATVAVIGIGTAAARRARKRKAKKNGKKVVPEDYLSGYVAPGATVAASDRVLSDIQTPIYLSGEDLGWDIGLRTTEGDILLVPEAEFGEGADDIGSLVTNLYFEALPLIYEYGLHLIGNEGYTDPHLIGQATMFRLRPQINWEGELTEGSAEDLVLRGAVTMAAVGLQSLENAFPPMPTEPDPLKGKQVGAILAQGTEGPVQWRVVWAYEHDNPNSPRPAYGPGETRNVFDGEFLDSEQPILGGGWESFGWGYYDLESAIANTKTLAQERPWAG